MLCDSPTSYEQEPEYTSLIAEIPATWNWRRCLDGLIGEYVVMKCVSDDVTYIAGLNGNTARTVTVSLESVLGDVVEIYCDSIDSASGYRYATFPCCDIVEIEMAAGGGFLLRVKR
jgi:alpha-glucosidase